MSQAYPVSLAVALDQAAPTLGEMPVMLGREDTDTKKNCEPY